MPTPKTWTDRAADILLDERNKRYLGMTREPTDQPAIFDPATEATRGTPTGQRDQAANHKEPLSPAHFTPPASGPLTSGSNEPEGLDVERLAEILPWAIGGQIGLYTTDENFRAIAERIVARLTAATSASDQEAEG